MVIKVIVVDLLQYKNVHVGTSLKDVASHTVMLLSWAIDGMRPFVEPSA